jgi:acyl-CoA synthetase (AMP-forming)/AMP-acid ligase II
VGTFELFHETAASAVTIGTRIRRHASQLPDHTAVMAAGFAPLSYRQLQSLIDKVHVGLRLAGFGHSARIAIVMQRGSEAALAVVAIACSAVCIPLNPRQTVGEIEATFASLRPDAVVVAKGFDWAGQNVAERKGIKVIEATFAENGVFGFHVAELETSIVPAPDLSDEPDADAPAFILQTSGTSAQPKLIPVSHRNMLAAAKRVQAWFELTPQDRCLSVSPVYYAHGLHVTVFAPLLSGGSIAFPTDVSRFDFAEWFGTLKPTWYSAGPTLHRLVLDQTIARSDARTAHSLRFVLSGGAPLPSDVLEGLSRTLGVPVLEHYGSSEGMQICSNLLVPGRFKAGTVGIPWPDTIRIVGEDGNPVHVGEQGEILVGGPTVVSGYLDAPELNRESFVNSWFKSGDIGSLDADKFLTLHGRKDDLINRGGEKISPSEIDDALMRHPAVAEAAAFPVPHPRLGQEVAAAVVLRHGATITPIELRGYLQKQLASFKVPRRILIEPQLPKGQTGKVLRRRLTDFFETQASAEIRAGASEPADNPDFDGDLATKVTKIWERVLKITPLSLDDDFFEKGGDSLLAMDMLVELEQLTGQPVTTSVLFDAPTIRLLVQTISDPTGLMSKSLFRLHSNGSQTPLVYFHGEINWPGYTAVILAKLLGPDQPLFIVEPHRVGKELIPRTIEAMAADRLALILEAQPEGPYRLCGNCLGGIIAFEVARLLMAAGKKVEMVMMLDSPTINAFGFVQLLLSTLLYSRSILGPVAEPSMEWTWFWCGQLQKFFRFSWSRQWTAVHRRLPGFAVGKSNRETASLGGRRDLGVANSERSYLDEDAAVRARFQRRMKYARVMSRYIPKPLAVRVIYFSVDFGGSAWRRVSPDLEIIKSAGIHYDLDFEDIATHIRARLHMRGKPT